MEPQMEAMLERLKSVENVEQMINLEDEIAKALGHGFLKGVSDAHERECGTDRNRETRGFRNRNGRKRKTTVQI